MNKEIKVWDLPTRLFHWSLLSAVVYSWFSIKVLEDLQHHFYAGYMILTLLLFRIFWGFAGSHYSRFYSFLFSISELTTYSKTMTFKSERHYLGHNPLGGLSAMAILAVLMMQASLGLFSNDDYSFGPLSGLVSGETRAWISAQHLANENLVYALLGLHVFAIAYYKLWRKEPLTKAMITGNKQTNNMAAEQPKAVSNLVALILFLLCTAIVYWLANAYTDLLPAADYY